MNIMIVPHNIHERCYQAVFDHYVPSEAARSRPAIEKLVALSVAIDADDSGLIPPLDIESIAQRSRLSIRTTKFYVSVLFDIGWLVESFKAKEVTLHIDRKWLRNSPRRQPVTGG
jgi:hypothetical protein